LEESLNADESKYDAASPLLLKSDDTLVFRFLSAVLPNALVVIDQFISRACGGFCVGCCLSLADIKVFHFFNPARFRQEKSAWQSLLPQLLAQYPQVSRLITTVAAVSGIKEWMLRMHPSSVN
jgi:glutathione S-transferase